MNKKIKELEKQLNKISEELESLKKEEQEWPQLGDDCFYCISSGQISETTWNDCDSDQRSFELGNFYKTKEEVQNKVRAARLEAAIARRRKELNGEWVPDWRGAQNNYHIYSRYWGPEGETLAFGFYKSRDDARTIIEKYQDELSWFFYNYLPQRN